jgi:hypothetical protein
MISSQSFRFSEVSLSPVYNLLSRMKLGSLTSSSNDLRSGLSEAKNWISIINHSIQRTQIEWILSNRVEDSELFDQVVESVRNQANELERKRQRARSLNLCYKHLEESLKGIPSGPLRCMSRCLIPLFEQAFSQDDILSTSSIAEARQRVEKFCAKAFSVIGSSMIEALLVHASPAVIHKRFTEKKDVQLDHSELRELIRAPRVVSSYFAAAIEISKDLVVIEEFARISRVEKDKIWVYMRELFGEKDMRHLAQCVKNFVFSAPNEVNECVFSCRELEALDAFVRAFS